MEYQNITNEGHTLIYSSSWITELESQSHFELYYHQANCVYSHCRRDQNILEIGIGTGLLSDLLKRRGWNITTLDIDQNKSPDICANAVDFDYESKNIDVVLAFEVFEHLPYALFEKLLGRLSNSGVSHIHFSLPWNGRTLLNTRIIFPKNKQLQFNISGPSGRIKTPTHHWELSKQQKSLGTKHLVKMSQLESTLKKNGYRLSKIKKSGYVQFLKAERL